VQLPSKYAEIFDISAIVYETMESQNLVKWDVSVLARRITMKPKYCGVTCNGVAAIWDNRE
jgi:hypothetical protein